MCRFFAVREKKEKKEPKKRKKSKLLVNYNLRDARPQANSKQHALGQQVQQSTRSSATAQLPNTKNQITPKTHHFYIFTCLPLAITHILLYLLKIPPFYGS